jgi:putative DNA-invertase from lambdoid prophage Rac
MIPYLAIVLTLFLVGAVLASPPAKEVLVALYARVSTADQHCDMQLTEMRADAERRGWKVAAEYIEHASGKAGARRPQQQKLLKDAAERKFDAVMVWKMDRFGRSLDDFVQNVCRLDGAGVRFLVPSQGIDTDQRNPMAKAMMQLMMVFAELERSLIAERVSSGLQEYRRAYDRGQVGKGKLRRSRSGKDEAVGRPRCVFRRDLAAERRAEGWSWRRLATEYGVSVRTLRRELKAS